MVPKLSRTPKAFYLALILKILPTALPSVGLIDLSRVRGARFLQLHLSWHPEMKFSWIFCAGMQMVDMSASEYVGLDWKVL
jgi:hypothetical protein